MCDLVQPPGMDLVTPGQAPGWEEEMLGDFPKLGHQKPSTLAPTYGVADRARAERGGAGRGGGTTVPDEQPDPASCSQMQPPAAGRAALAVGTSARCST